MLRLAFSVTICLLQIHFIDLQIEVNYPGQDLIRGASHFANQTQGRLTVYIKETHIEGYIVENNEVRLLENRLGDTILMNH